jgi:hypothetical protein
MQRDRNIASGDALALNVFFQFVWEIPIMSVVMWMMFMFAVWVWLALRQTHLRGYIGNRDEIALVRYYERKGCGDQD